MKNAREESELAGEAAERATERATELIGLLTRVGQTVATAESLTGGMVAAMLVGVPGASEVFRGGLIVYATDLKASLTDVPADVLAAHGPVNGEVALAMARGAARRCGADWGIATTGVAGPADHDGHPPGECYVAVASSQKARQQVRHVHISGGRAVVRVKAVIAALNLAFDLVSACSSNGPTRSR